MSGEKKFLILHDNRGYVANSLLADAGRKISIQKLKETLEKEGATVEVKNLHNLKFPTEYKGWYVVYPSSEDNGLLYKGFIEDVLLRLRMDEAILLPRFELFRAHHNKVFMELCRTAMSKKYQSLQSKCFYSMSDLRKILEEPISYPVVLKTAEGAGSSGVTLAGSRQEAIQKARRMGRCIMLRGGYGVWAHIRHIIGTSYRKIKSGMTGVTIAERATEREKMILQPFIPGLKNDYKVLVFGEKYYLLRRNVREGDFRASGSGKLEFPTTFTDVERKVLDYAKGAYGELDTPLLSIDIAYDGKKCHMVEFQCLNFGPYTLQFSGCYYTDSGNGWERWEGKSILEEEMAKAYMFFVKKHEME